MRLSTKTSMYINTLNNKKDDSVKNVDWQMVIFIGASLLHDYWIHLGLPQVYYWEVKREIIKNSK